jgi:hypothetical protein
MELSALEYITMRYKLKAEVKLAEPSVRGRKTEMRSTK